MLRRTSQLDCSRECRFTSRAPAVSSLLGSSERLLSVSILSPRAIPIISSIESLDSCSPLLRRIGFTFLIFVIANNITVAQRTTLVRARHSIAVVDYTATAWLLRVLAGSYSIEVDSIRGDSPPSVTTIITIVNITFLMCKDAEVVSRNTMCFIISSSQKVYSKESRADVDDSLAWRSILLAEA